MKKLLISLLLLVPVKGNSQSYQEKVFISALNEYRASKGLPPVVYDSILSKAAEYQTLYEMKVGRSTHFQDSNVDNFKEIRTFEERISVLSGSNYSPVGEITRAGYSVKPDGFFFYPGVVMDFPTKGEYVVPSYILTDDPEKDEAIVNLRDYIASVGHNEILIKPGNLKVGISYRYANGNGNMFNVVVFARN